MPADATPESGESTAVACIQLSKLTRAQCSSGLHDTFVEVVDKLLRTGTDQTPGCRPGAAALYAEHGIHERRADGVQRRIGHLQVVLALHQAAREPLMELGLHCSATVQS